MSAFALSVLFACSESSPAPAAQSPPATNDAGVGTDASTSDATAAVQASTYCETVVEFFCAFYMRCGRMVAADEAECRAVFLESCNERYETRYVDLEKASLLRLSKDGIDACAAHLANVECEKQPLDLAGPCAGMWAGTQEVGEPCGLDVESFVCRSGATCTLGLNLCGTCETAAARGADCGDEIRCTPEDACVEGKCKARALPGETCSDTAPCITGASCNQGKCKSPEIVGEGETCDASHRCAYRAYCEGGECRKASLLGETCAADRACASGRCQSGKCVPLRAESDTCAGAAECASASCVSGKCHALPSACF